MARQRGEGLDASSGPPSRACTYKELASARSVLLLGLANAVLGWWGDGREVFCDALLRQQN
jgi:hypothetical protein